MSEDNTCADETVLAKYKAAGTIVNKVLKSILAVCVDGASVRKVCEDGENCLAAELSKVYKKEKDIKKGVAFPVCVSVNNCINHFSPLPQDTDIELKNGDLVKADLGAHIDGYIAVAAHSVVIGASGSNKVTGRAADIMLAAYYASEVALHLFKPGKENYDVTDAVNKVLDPYECKPVDGMISFQIQQNQIDGEKLIHLNATTGLKKDVDKFKFEEYEVYGMDVIISTGKGQGREMDTKVTVYKKTDEVYNLKLRCSKEFFRNVKRYGTMPFSLRHFEDLKKARMGVMECVTHKLIAPYPVLWEKQGELVAQFKYTVIVMPNGPLRITGLPFDDSFYQSDVKIRENEDVQALLEATAKLGLSSKK